MPDDEALHGAGGLVVYRMAVDVRGHVVGDGVEESVYLARLALGDEFHVAGGEVAHVPRNGKALGELPRAVAEADALDLAGVAYALANGHGRLGNRTEYTIPSPGCPVWATRQRRLPALYSVLGTGYCVLGTLLRVTAYTPPAASGFA